MVEEKEMDNSTDEKGSIEKSISLDEISDEFKIEEKEPRPFYIAMIITILFVFGPFFLFIDWIFSSLFSFMPVDSTLIFGIISLLFFGSAVVNAMKDANKYN